MIYINCVDIAILLLHVKFQDNRTVGSKEKKVLKIFTIYGLGGHFGYHYHAHLHKLPFSYLRDSPHEIGSDWPGGMVEEDL